MTDEEFEALARVDAPAAKRVLARGELASQRPADVMAAIDPRSIEADGFVTVHVTGGVHGCIGSARPGATSPGTETCGSGRSAAATRAIDPRAPNGGVR